MSVLEDWTEKLAHKIQALGPERVDLMIHFLQGDHTFVFRPLSDQPDDIEAVVETFRSDHGEPDAIAIVVPGYRYVAPIPEVAPSELHQAAFEFGEIAEHPDREEIVSLLVSTPEASVTIEWPVTEGGTFGEPDEGGELFFRGEKVDLWSKKG